MFGTHYPGGTHVCDHALCDIQVGTVATHEKVLFGQQFINDPTRPPQRMATPQVHGVKFCLVTLHQQGEQHEEKMSYGPRFTETSSHSWAIRCAPRG